MASLSILAVIFGFVVFSITAFIFHLRFPLDVKIFLSIATAVVGISFNRIKPFFDKVTNHLFYQDAYDPERLFDNLNRQLVTTFDLDTMLRHVTSLLTEELKATYCLIGLKEIVGRPQRLIGTQKIDIDLKDILALRRVTIKYHQSIITTDSLLEKRHAELKRILVRNNVEVLVRLAPNIARNEEGLGYLIFGPKKSGNPYTEKDRRVLDTIANELIIAIQNALHFEEIQNFNLTLQEKVEQATSELRRTNEKLKSLDETKDDFISMASHQLRTPLTSIKGYLSMVLEGDAGKLTPTERKMLSQAFASSQRMVYLISDLLNVSRLKTGKFIINAEPINLAELITDEIAQLKETAAGRRLNWYTINRRISPN